MRVYVTIIHFVSYSRYIYALLRASLCTCLCALLSASHRLVQIGNYSAPIEVSPIGMSDHLTVLQQQELHCISNFRSS